MGGECVTHVNTFLEEDTKDERSAFIWKLALAKCKQECANTVYDKKPKTATEVIETMCGNSSTGLVSEYGRRSRFSHLLRKEMFVAVMVGMMEVYLSLNQV